MKRHSDKEAEVQHQTIIITPSRSMVEMVSVRDSLIAMGTNDGAGIEYDCALDLKTVESVAIEQRDILT